MAVYNTRNSIVDKSKFLLGSPIESPFPSSIRSLTFSEQRKGLNYLYGEVIVDGKGEVKLVYPKVNVTETKLTLPNIRFGIYTYALLQAIPQPGSKFLGWYDGLDLISSKQLLPLTVDFCTEVETFYAKFQ